VKLDKKQRKYKDGNKKGFPDKEADTKAHAKAVGNEEEG